MLKGVGVGYFRCKKKSHYNFIKIVIFGQVTREKKVGSGYLCHLTFILSKFSLKNFIFFEIVSDIMVSSNIFLCLKLPQTRSECDV